MKNMMKTLLLGAIAMTTFGFFSCSDDDMGPSIFDTREYPLDRSAYSFPLDTFLKVTYLEPYNMQGRSSSKSMLPASSMSSGRRTSTRARVRRRWVRLAEA